MVGMWLLGRTNLSDIRWHVRAGVLEPGLWQSVITKGRRKVGHSKRGWPCLVQVALGRGWRIIRPSVGRRLGVEAHLRLSRNGKLSGVRVAPGRGGRIIRPSIDRRPGVEAHLRLSQDRTIHQMASHSDLRAWRLNDFNHGFVIEGQACDLRQSIVVKSVSIQWGCDLRQSIIVKSGSIQ